MAQSVDTQPLSVTSICAGSQLDVSANRAGVTNDFSVELSSDGAIYSAIPSTPVSTSGSTEVTYRATIPANIAAGSNYRIRVVSSNSTVFSTPSVTVLTIRPKPAIPKVDSLILDCQYISPSASVYSFIYTEVMPNATSTLYNENLSVQQVIQGTAMVGSTSYTTFQISKTGYFSAKYVYPVKDLTFYLTQSVNDCESDRAKTVVRLLYRPVTGPVPVNAKSVEVPFHLPNTYYGSLAYCQGEKASPLSVNGYAAPPENYIVSSRLLPDNQFSTSAVTPNTNSPSSQVYEFALQPIDSKKGCANYGQLNTQLTVRVKAKPEPVLAPAEIVVCEKPNGSSSPFMGVSLTVTSPIAVSKLYNKDGSIPYNDSSVQDYYIIVKGSPGTTFYYATQLVDGCESDKQEIKVIVKPHAPEVSPINIYSTGGEKWGAISYNQGDKAVSLREYGLQPLPDNVVVYYLRESGDLAFTGLTDVINANSSGGTTDPVIPKTDKPGKAVVTFRTSLEGCSGSIYNQGHLVVTVNPALGIEDQSLANSVDIYPVPAVTNLTVHIRGLEAAQPAVLELADMTGCLIRRQETRQTISSLSLESYPPGTYILTIQVADRRASKRIVKL